MSVNDDADNELNGITLIPEPSQERLSQREALDYRSHRRSLIDWMLHFGKNPDRAEGYAWETTRRRASNLDMFYRWVWGEFDSYTTTITHDHANSYTRQLARDDNSRTHKSNLQKSIEMLFKWRSRERGGSEWEPEMRFHENSSTSQPRDYFTRDERRKLREAALDYGAVPHYCSVTPEERRAWKAHLARRFKKPMSEIGREDFERANGFKIPSLVWTSLDAGLRPMEVERAKTSWVDVDNAVLRIPAQESVKNDHNWTVAIQQRTADALERWMEERELYGKYDDSEHLWLTRESNPYQSAALKFVLGKLLELTDIEEGDRSLSWYAIRHGAATAMAREEGLAAAQSQLRHVSARTTMKYDQAPIEDRRNALDRMG